jgi:hypothetical protein
LAERAEERHIKRILAEPQHADIVSRLAQATDGKLYLIGSFLYRNLSSALIGTTAKASDMDFCVDGRIDMQKLSKLFGQIEQNRRFNALMITHKDAKIDLFELGHYDFVPGDPYAHSIMGYVRGVPFTVQAIAYDIAGDRIIDGGALLAILRMEIRVNNAPKFRSDPERYMKQALRRSQEMGFALRGLEEA